MIRSRQGLGPWFMNSAVRRNAILTELLFGVRPHHGERIYWDFTTLVLRSALKRAVRDGMKILEIGAGPYALLALYIEKHFQCKIDGTDINQIYVDEAARDIANRKSKVAIFQSDLFQNIAATYDLIYSNTLYIPRRAGHERGLETLHSTETDWCGGETGYEYIDRLLMEAPSFLTKEGAVLLGFNSFYLDEGKIRVLCIDRAFEIVSETKNKLNPGRAYLLRYTPDGSRTSAGLK